ncbi:hypothetical protein EfmAA96_20650 [Enterococcus faecium]|nr:hypothetical protein EfmAA96_20650 [Enterococcus faecium]
MVFVTVGTHEQQFNRLLQAVDSWAENREDIAVSVCIYFCFL